MGFWSKLFGKKKNSPDEEANSPYLPLKKNHIEIVFAEKFTLKGGKFVYSDDSNSTGEFFNLILEENHWNTQRSNTGTVLGTAQYVERENV